MNDSRYKKIVPEADNIIQMTNRDPGRGRKTGYIVALALVLLAAIGILLFVFFQKRTFSRYRVVSSEELNSETAASYRTFQDGFVRYTIDGISYILKNGDEVWQQSYEMSSPVVESCDGALVVYDKGGSRVCVMDGAGLKGQFSTDLPVVLAKVSSQGIVSAILKNDAETRVVTYDAKGTVLAEGKASIQNTGYPLALAIAKDGKHLLVSYLVIGDEASTHLVCYSFDPEDKGDADGIVLEETLEGEICPEAAALDEKTLVAFGDSGMIFYSIGSTVKEKSRVEYGGQVKSVAAGSGNAVVVLKTPDSADKYELAVYGADGKEKCREGFSSEYTTLAISEDQILLYGDNHADSFSETGTRIFSGELSHTAVVLFPASGWRSYYMITNDEKLTIRLKK